MVAMKICPVAKFLLTICVSIWVSGFFCLGNLVEDGKELTDSLKEQSGVYSIVNVVHKHKFIYIETSKTVLTKTHNALKITS